MTKSIENSIEFQCIKLFDWYLNFRCQTCVQLKNSLPSGFQTKLNEFFYLIYSNLFFHRIHTKTNFTVQ